MATATTTVTFPLISSRNTGGCGGRSPEEGDSSGGGMRLLGVWRPLSFQDFISGGENVVDRGAAVDPDLLLGSTNLAENEIDLQEVFQGEPHVLVEPCTLFMWGTEKVRLYVCGIEPFVAMRCCTFYGGHSFDFDTLPVRLSLVE